MRSSARTENTNKNRQVTQRRLQRKQDVYDQMQQFHQQGMSIHRIAEEVNVARNTVRRSLHMEDGLGVHNGLARLRTTITSSHDGRMVVTMVN